MFLLLLLLLLLFLLFLLLFLLFLLLFLLFLLFLLLGCGCFYCWWTCTASRARNLRRAAEQTAVGVKRALGGSHHKETVQGMCVYV